MPSHTCIALLKDQYSKLAHSHSRVAPIKGDEAEHALCTGGFIEFVPKRHTRVSGGGEGG